MARRGRAPCILSLPQWPSRRILHVVRFEFVAKLVEDLSAVRDDGRLHRRSGAHLFAQCFRLSRKEASVVDMRLVEVKPFSRLILDISYLDLRLLADGAAITGGVRLTGHCHQVEERDVGRVSADGSSCHHGLCSGPATRLRAGEQG